jgi:hypothetical protein
MRQRIEVVIKKSTVTYRITADLPLMDDAHRCARRNQDGFSLRVWEASDIRNDERLMRIDVLYGHKVLRPEWATNITD